ncbi:hypothetical protein HanXRQr2_Chr06g0277211 [Helianthus annuus]|uniref:Uncharacterized protein n=1 Tax=Helianthus annuus TaxID=4232 RepID=A0A9K3NKT6_HELAN|nr:hypothetical protein HanXRQr2_Chr06g0277211 [Helianthus annuus]
MLLTLSISIHLSITYVILTILGSVVSPQTPKPTTIPYVVPLGRLGTITPTAFLIERLQTTAMSFPESSEPYKHTNP